MKYKLYRLFQIIVFASMPVSMLVFSYLYQPEPIKVDMDKTDNKDVSPQYDNTNLQTWIK
tara:strand:- start:1029 stop:1208 length:180 start_codon:yes stop_codon:yes gene_type:complete